ncbi:hypothetical protein [Kocuria arenosa]
MGISAVPTVVQAMATGGEPMSVLKVVVLTMPIVGVARFELTH